MAVKVKGNQIRAKRWEVVERAIAILLENSKLRPEECFSLILTIEKPNETKKETKNSPRKARKIGKNT